MFGGIAQEKDALATRATMVVVGFSSGTRLRLAVVRGHFFWRATDVWPGGVRGEKGGDPSEARAAQVVTSKRESSALPVGGPKTAMASDVPQRSVFSPR